jgi:hypothetical protein
MKVKVMLMMRADEIKMCEDDMGGLGFVYWYRDTIECASHKMEVKRVDIVMTSCGKFCATRKKTKKQIEPV